MRRHLALAAAAAASALLAPSASAAPKPQIVDPSGDVQLGGTASHDVLSLTLETTKTVTTSKVRGRTVRKTTPKDWVVTLVFRGAPDPSPQTGLMIRGTAERCGSFNVETKPNLGGETREGYAYFWPCDGREDPGPLPVTLRTTSNAYVWTIPAASIPVPAGNVYTKIRVSVSPREPVVRGYTTGDGPTGLAYDVAATTTPYRFGF